MRPCLHTAETGVLSSAPGYDRIRLTTAAHWQGGQRIKSPEASWVTVSSRSSFFCHSKVIETLSASLSHGSSWLSSCPFQKKRMLRRRRMSVRLFSACGTFRYSQDLHAKNIAPIESWEMACRVLVSCFFASSTSTQRGRAFCWTGFGSAFRYARNWRNRSRPSSPSLSLVRFGLSFSRKVCATNEMAPLTVPSASAS